MNARKWSNIVSLLVVMILFVAACSPAAAPTVLNDGIRADAEKPAALAIAPAQPAAMPPTMAPAATAASAGADHSTIAQVEAGAPNASPYGQSRMIIKNGEMNLMVADTDRAIDQVTNVAVGVGGYLISARTWIQDGFKYASISMGIPVDQFEAAQRQLRALAVKVLSDTASGQDVSDEYVDLQSRLTNLQATEARIREFLDKATKVEEALQVNAQLTEIEGQIEQVKGRMQYLKDRAAFSTILVNIEQQRPTPTPTATPTPTPTPTPIAWMPEKTFNAAADTLSTMLRAIGDLLIWVSVVIVPFGVPALAIVLVARRVRKKK